MNPISRRAALKTAGTLAASCVLPAIAQSTWPTKPIRLLVPFAPGGSSEIVARSAANELSKSLGQAVFVENKPGASGNIAMQECAQSTDGHTIILGHIGTFAVNPFIFDKLPFDTNKDFKPISLLAKVPSLYVVNAEVPAKNLKEFIALAKAKPGRLNYGSAGNGSAGHLAFEYLKWSATPLYCTCPTAAPARNSPTCSQADWTPPAWAHPPFWRMLNQANCAASPPAPKSACRNCPTCLPWPKAVTPALR